MILTFSKDSFIKSIKNGTKKHTIRQDKTNRWKKGMDIHFWRGNPRNVKSNPYQFGKGKCIDIASIEIFPDKNIVKISYDGINYDTLYNIDMLNDLAVNDGFRDWENMKEWFSKDFKGKMIFWDNAVSLCNDLHKIIAKELLPYKNEFIRWDETEIVSIRKEKK